MGHIERSPPFHVICRLNEGAPCHHLWVTDNDVKQHRSKGRPPRYLPCCILQAEHDPAAVTLCAQTITAGGFPASGAVSVQGQRTCRASLSEGHVRTQPGWRRRGAQGLWASRPCQLNSVNLPLCSITVCYIDYDIWVPSINLTGFSKDFPFCLPAEGDGGGINIEIIGSVGATHSTWRKETKWSRRCNLKCHEGPNSESCQVLLYIQGS